MHTGQKQGGKRVELRVKIQVRAAERGGGGGMLRNLRRQSGSLRHTPVPDPSLSRGHPHKNQYTSRLPLASPRSFECMSPETITARQCRQRFPSPHQQYPPNRQQKYATKHVGQGKILRASINGFETVIWRFDVRRVLASCVSSLCDFLERVSGVLSI